MNHPERPSLDEELRAALGPETAEFDYDALVAGTKRRARRIQRRRAAAQAAVAAVVVPALAASGWFVSQRLATDPGTVDLAGPSASLAPEPLASTAEPTMGADVAAGTQDPGGAKRDDATTEAVRSVPGPAAPTAESPSESPSESTATQLVRPTADLDPSDAPSGDDRSGAATSGEADTPAVENPPYQDPSALVPPVEVAASIPNRVAIPDPRPTGIEALNALGVPEHSSYPRVTPWMGFLMSRDNIGLPEGGVEAHSGESWTWSGGDAWADGHVELVVTAWDDAGLAMDQLRSGGTELGFVWPDVDADGAPDSMALSRFPGHEGDSDWLVAFPAEGSPAEVAQVGALIRQGDYLIGVSVITASETEAMQLAATIAEQTAANLAHLDPALAGR